MRPPPEIRADLALSRPVQEVRILAKHQLADVLPHGVICTCGEELTALNAPLDDVEIKGEPLALAVHQLGQLTLHCGPAASGYFAEPKETPA